MSLRSFFPAWLVTSAALFGLNGVFHGLAAADFFDTHFAGLGAAAVKMKDFNPLPIVILELAFGLCLALIVTRLRNERIVMKEALLTGALFYLSTALSWNLANTATLVAWPVTVTLVDSAWHGATGLLAGWLICKLFNRQFRHRPA